MSAFELSDETLCNKYGLRAEVLDINNEEHLTSWCDIINHSYTEFSFDKESAKSFLENKEYYSDRITYLFTDSSNIVRGGVFCYYISGSIHQSSQSRGRFQNWRKKGAQGRGFGRLVVLYGFSRLRDRGLRVAESAIMIKRNKSLHLHFSLGFRPQYNPRYFALPASSKFYRLAKIIPLIKLHVSYLKYKNKEDLKILNQ